MTKNKNGRPPSYSEEQIIEGIEIVKRKGALPTGESVKKAMCDELGVAPGINALCLDKEVQRLVEELQRQRRNQLIGALPSESLSAAKDIGSLVASAVLDHMGEQHEKLVALAGRKLAEQNVDLGNQREQIRNLLSRLDRKDAEISELEMAKHKLQDRLDLAATEVGSLKKRVAELEDENDFETRMLAIIKNMGKSTNVEG
jgi:HAMP domain-containing protein